MNKPDQLYTPIDCGLHSEYELAIMHTRPLLLSWLDQDKREQNKKVLPLDLKTKDHQEYLVVRTIDTKAEQYEIRLDRILRSDVSEVNRK